ncbi:MAG: NF038130 family PEP-CTERM protein [Planctomycetes bacterium]|nr:NF038130 family PEP-CTERM protein [Planctomycetota bacterium]
MRTQSIVTALSAALTITTAALAADIPMTGSTIVSNPSGSTTAGTNYDLWKETAGVLAVNNAEPLANILAGNAAAPGGNAELFANSENGTFNSVSPVGAFRTTARIGISGTVNTNPITVNSVNGNDWFTTYGGSPVYDPTYSATPNTLARQWFKDFFDYYQFDAVLAGVGVSAGTIATEKTNLYNNFAAAGQFARISDPNISYVNMDSLTTYVHVGLAGSQSYIKTFIVAYIAGSANLTPTQKLALIGNPVNPSDGIVDLIDIQASEVFQATYKGATYNRYGFKGTATGLTTADATESFGLNFDLVIPEPASLSLIAMGGLLMLSRRRR